MADDRKSRGRRGALFGILSAFVPLALVWGFTVDDALITARVARHIALGSGARFNLDGPTVDAVTPLGFAHLLAPFAGSTLSAFTAARVIGALAWLGTGAYLGRAIALMDGKPERFLVLVTVSVSLPLGAWAGSGMETGVVTLLVTLATMRRRFAPLLAGLAAAWRPELLPWAMLLGVGTSITATRRPGPALIALIAVMAPAAVIALIRQIAFGSPMPLAALAKPSSLNDGIRYALVALGMCAMPYLVVAPRAVRSLDGHDRSLLFAGFLHFVSLALAGGDWMPLFRLAVPILPSLVLVGASIAANAARSATLIRLAAAWLASGILWTGLAFPSRSVWSARSELIRASTPVLAGAERVATLDAGWVGAAFEGHVVDAAGVTDPSVARLPGGHTSKQLPPDFLQRHRVDVVIALFDDERGGYFRVNDERMLGQAEALGFVRSAELPIRGTKFRYLVLKRPR